MVAPTDHICTPRPAGRGEKGWSEGAPEDVGGWGGEESVVNLPSAKKFYIAAMLLRDEDEKGTVLFRSVIFNSVGFNNLSKSYFLTPWC